MFADKKNLDKVSNIEPRQGMYPRGGRGGYCTTFAEFWPKSLVLAMNFWFLPPHFWTADKCPAMDIRISVYFVFVGF